MVGVARGKVEIIGADRKAQVFQGEITRMRGRTNAMLRRIGRFAVPILRQHTPKGATGRLREFTVFQIVGGPTRQTLEIRQEARAPGGAFYGRFVREGARPHFPPVAALIPWVKARMGAGSEKDARSKAFMVALAISRRGTRPNPYHRQALAQILPGARTIAAEFGREIAARLNK